MDRMKLRDKPMTAEEVLRLLNEEAAESRRENEELGLTDRTPGLNPIYAAADQQPTDGGLDFTVGMSGEDFGGPVQLPVRLTADALRDPLKVSAAFSRRVGHLFRLIGARFAGSLPD